MYSGHFTPQTRDCDFSKLSRKEKKAFGAFHAFHKEHLACGGKPAVLSRIIQRLMDVVFPPLLPEVIKAALTRDAQVQPNTEQPTMVSNSTLIQEIPLTSGNQSPDN